MYFSEGSASTPNFTPIFSNYSLPVKPSSTSMKELCVENWGSPKGKEMVLLHDYFVLFGFVIMAIIFTVLVVYLRKGGLMGTRGMYRNVRVNQGLEFSWSVLPMVLLVCMGYPSFCSLYDGSLGDSPKSMGLKVTGHQWYWNYEYFVNIEELVDQCLKTKALESAKGLGVLANSGPKKETLEGVIEGAEAEAAPMSGSAKGPGVLANSGPKKETLEGVIEGAEAEAAPMSSSAKSPGVLANSGPKKETLEGVIEGAEAEAAPMSSSAKSPGVLANSGPKKETLEGVIEGAEAEAAPMSRSANSHNSFTKLGVLGSILKRVIGGGGGSDGPKMVHYWFGPKGLTLFIEKGSGGPEPCVLYMTREGFNYLIDWEGLLYSITRGGMFFLGDSGLEKETVARLAGGYTIMLEYSDWFVSGGCSSGVSFQELMNFLGGEAVGPSLLGNAVLSRSVDSGGLPDSGLTGKILDYTIGSGMSKGLELWVDSRGLNFFIEKSPGGPQGFMLQVTQEGFPLLYLPSGFVYLVGSEGISFFDYPGFSEEQLKEVASGYWVIKELGDEGLGTGAMKSLSLVPKFCALENMGSNKGGVLGQSLEKTMASCGLHVRGEGSSGSSSPGCKEEWNCKVWQAGSRAGSAEHPAKAWTWSGSSWIVKAEGDVSRVFTCFESVDGKTRYKTNYPVDENNNNFMGVLNNNECFSFLGHNSVVEPVEGPDLPEPGLPKPNLPGDDNPISGSGTSSKCSSEAVGHKEGSSLLEHNNIVEPVEGPDLPEPGLPKPNLPGDDSPVSGSGTSSKNSSEAVGHKEGSSLLEHNNIVEPVEGPDLPEPGLPKPNLPGDDSPVSGSGTSSGCSPLVGGDGAGYKAEGSVKYKWGPDSELQLVVDKSSSSFNVKEGGDSSGSQEYGGPWVSKAGNSSPYSCIFFGGSWWSFWVIHCMDNGGDANPVGGTGSGGLDGTPDQDNAENEDSNAGGGGNDDSDLLNNHEDPYGDGLVAWMMNFLFNAVATIFGFAPNPDRIWETLIRPRRSNETILVEVGTPVDVCGMREFSGWFTCKEWRPVGLYLTVDGRMSGGSLVNSGNLSPFSRYGCMNYPMPGSQNRVPVEFGEWTVIFEFLTHSIPGLVGTPLPPMFVMPFDQSTRGSVGSAASTASSESHWNYWSTGGYFVGPGLPSVSTPSLTPVFSSLAATTDSDSEINGISPINPLNQVSLMWDPEYNYDEFVNLTVSRVFPDRDGVSAEVSFAERQLFRNFLDNMFCVEGVNTVRMVPSQISVVPSSVYLAPSGTSLTDSTTSNESFLGSIGAVISSGAIFSNGTASAGEFSITHRPEPFADSVVVEDGEVPGTSSTPEGEEGAVGGLVSQRKKEYEALVDLGKSGKILPKDLPKKYSSAPTLTNMIRLRGIFSGSNINQSDTSVFHPRFVGGPTDSKSAPAISESPNRGNSVGVQVDPSSVKPVNINSAPSISGGLDQGNSVGPQADPISDEPVNVNSAPALSEGFNLWNTIDFQPGASNVKPVVKDQAVPSNTVLDEVVNPTNKVESDDGSHGASLIDNAQKKGKKIKKKAVAVKFWDKRHTFKLGRHKPSDGGSGPDRGSVVGPQPGPSGVKTMVKGQTGPSNKVVDSDSNTESDDGGQGGALIDKTQKQGKKVKKKLFTKVGDDHNSHKLERKWLEDDDDSDGPGGFGSGPSQPLESSHGGGKVVPSNTNNNSANFDYCEGGMVCGVYYEEVAEFTGGLNSVICGVFNFSSACFSFMPIQSFIQFYFANSYSSLCLNWLMVFEEGCVCFITYSSILMSWVSSYAYLLMMFLEELIKIFCKSWPASHMPVTWAIGFDSYLVFFSSLMMPWGFKYGCYVDYPAVLMGDSNIEVKVTSADVVHSWTINGLGVKVDAIPGRINTVQLSGLRPGFSAWGGCSEMCGVNHWQMGAEVEVLSRKDFNLWLLTLVYHELKEVYKF